jgi:hypothetical protein
MHKYIRPSDLSVTRCNMSVLCDRVLLTLSSSVWRRMVSLQSFTSQTVTNCKTKTAYQITLISRISRVKLHID